MHPEVMVWVFLIIIFWWFFFLCVCFFKLAHFASVKHTMNLLTEISEL